LDRLTDSERALVFAPIGRDAELTARVLSRFGIETRVCGGVDELCAMIREGAGCAIVTEEALGAAGREKLVALLAEQSPWSDFPLVVFGARLHGDSAAAMDAVRVLGNVSLLDRPVKTRTLVSAVRAALRGRGRQYEARRAIEQRDRFLAMLGHELRNPLAAILLASESLKLSREAPSLASKHAIIDRQARHLARLVDDLLDVSRVTSGKIALRRTRVDLEQLLRRCAQSVEGIARGHAIEVIREPGATSIAVDGDVVRLEQVFTNLLANAVKYSPAGSPIRLRLAAPAGQAEVVVEDEGVGIAPDMLHRVFELFTQAESTLERAQGGMGIGLTLVKSLVELHGGTVEARSEGIGRGSRFVVRLPRAQAAEAQPSPQPPARPAAARRRVVLVEDNEDIRETSRELLEQLGCEVTTAKDGPSGLACLLSNKPDVALVDIGLPGIDGYEVGRAARGSLGDSIVLVALTGYGLPEDRRRARDAGFDSHLTKPVTIEALARALSLPANG